jgi:hypothetical protein
MTSEAEGLPGAAQKLSPARSPRFGPNTAEVEAFIRALALLTPGDWRRVLTARRRVASVTNEPSGHAGVTIKSIRAAIRGKDGQLSQDLASAGKATFAALGKQSSERLLAAWQAASALVMRHHLPALKFAAHYAPFVDAVPAAGADDVDATVRRFLAALAKVTAEQCEVLARPWRLEHEASRALLEAVSKVRPLKTEEAVALAALKAIPPRLPGDAGWAAARTAVHGGRVLGCRGALPEAGIAALWAPLEAAIPLASLNESAAVARPKRTRARADARPPVVPKAPGPYGPNSAEVAAFARAVTELTPIQWLRVLDRRKLVAGVTREGSAEPAGAVRAMLAAIEGSTDLDILARCRAFAAADRAANAFDARSRLTADQLAHSYQPFAGLGPAQEADAAAFARRLASLGGTDWEQIAAAAPAVNGDAIAPLVNVGSILAEFLAGRSDDEAVATWHAVSALVRRHQLTPIKFAASYAPFASAIPVTRSKALGAMVLRYVTAVGRLSAVQCEALAQPWQVEDEISNALSRAIADGSARPAEEAAALAAVVTVPMRVPGNAGWAAVKTAAYGGRVIASRARLSPAQMDALWKPIQPAIPLASVVSASPSRR